MNPPNIAKQLERILSGLADIARRLERLERAIAAAPADDDQLTSLQPPNARFPVPRRSPARGPGWGGWMVNSRPRLPPLPAPGTRSTP